MRNKLYFPKLNRKLFNGYSCNGAILIHISDINKLILTATNQNLELITTEKDYVKINNKNKLIHVLSIEMDLSVEDKSRLKLFFTEKLNAKSFHLSH